MICEWTFLQFGHGKSATLHQNWPISNQTSSKNWISVHFFISKSGYLLAFLSAFLYRHFPAFIDATSRRVTTDRLAGRSFATWPVRFTIWLLGDGWRWSEMVGDGVRTFRERCEVHYGTMGIYGVTPQVWDEIDELRGCSRLTKERCCNGKLPVFCKTERHPPKLGTHFNCQVLFPRVFGGSRIMIGRVPRHHFIQSQHLPTSSLNRCFLDVARCGRCI